jgi:uncharacterized membrane protein
LGDFFEGVEMAVMQADVPRFEMGRVVKRTFSVIGHNIGTFALLSLIPGIPLAAMNWGMAGLPSGAAAFGQITLNTIGLFVLSILVYLVTTFVLQASVVHGTVADLNGKRASLADCLATGIRHFVPLFLIALLVGLGVMAGSLLFLVPGIMIAVAWSVAVPVRVVEHTGVTASLSRSGELTKGHRWAIFVLVVAFVILQMIVGGVIGAFIGVGFVAASADKASAAVAVTTSWPYIASSTIVTMITAVIASAGVASIYYELRSIKEGIGPEALASVFD